MNQSLTDISTILNSLTAVIAACGALFAALAVIVKPIRTWLGSKISNQHAIERQLQEIKTSFDSLKNEVNEIKNQNNTQNTDIKLIKDATLCTTRDTLTHIYYQAEKAGGLSHYNKENFEKMYQAYTNLGGNSYIHEIREKVLNMNTVDD